MPPGTGYLQEGTGWIANVTTNSTLYLALDIAVLGVHSYLPRLYKRITFVGSGSVVQVR